MVHDAAAEAAQPESEREGMSMQDELMALIMELSQSGDPILIAIASEVKRLAYDPLVQLRAGLEASPARQGNECT